MGLGPSVSPDIAALGKAVKYALQKEIVPSMLPSGAEQRRGGARPGPDQGTLELECLGGCSHCSKVRTKGS